MNLEAYLTPAGRVHVRLADAAKATDAAEAQIRAQFESSVSAGLIELASQENPLLLPATLGFWRHFARLVFQGLCHLGESAVDAWGALPQSAPGEMAKLLDNAPPMLGTEYLTEAVLERLWIELGRECLVRAKAFPGGPAAWISSIDPMFHLVGRVHFHLAENKSNAERPFAFLATYTHKISQAAKVQHLPLAQALKEYAGAQDRARLEALLQPVRKAAQTIPLVSDLLEKRALFAPQAWSIAEAHRFLLECLNLEESGIVVSVPDWWTKRATRRPEVRVSLGTRNPQGLGLEALMDFEVELALGDESLTRQELGQLMESSDTLMLLRGKWIEVDREKIQQALAHWKQLEKENPEGVSFIQGMRMLSGVELEKGDRAPEAVSGWTRLVEGPWLAEMLGSLRGSGSEGKSASGPEGKNACAIEPGRGLQATLRPYQTEGVNWLYFMTRMGLGACLADDMGLGKTIQVLDLLLQSKRVHGNAGFGPSLLVVPASLLGNWKAEAARFAPELKLFLAHRSECDRALLAKVESDPQKQLEGYDLVITTYAHAAQREWAMMRTWSLVILDEAQAIKNAGSAQARALKKIPCKGRIVLTGTPVENHLGDLWSLFDFCCPGLLGNAAQFKKFLKSTEAASAQDQAGAAKNQYGALRRLVRPYILRRLKTDPGIAPDLPGKTEMRVDCSLSKKQAVLYAKALEALETSLEESTGIARRGQVLATLMQLKQICNHPDLFQRALTSGRSFRPEESGKFDRLRSLCEPIKERQEKFLVFTQFQSMTEPLAEFLATFMGRTGLVLHGGTPVKRRSELVKQFQDDDGPPFFVISLKAGGSGLNLTAGSHVIHFDRWWNPAVENQATDRAFRIGQKRKVMVHKFVCRGTVEERIDQVIAGKSQLANEILGQDEQFPLLTEMSNRDLLDFLALDVERATAE